MVVTLKRKAGGRPKFKENWAELRQLSTTDPVLHYMQAMGKCMEIGHMPDAYMPKATSEMIIDDVRKRIFDAMAQLFGQRHAKFLNSIGFTNITRHHVLGRVTNNQTPLHLRVAIAMLMTHISAIRDHLLDMERGLWVALQQSHDPRLCTYEDYMDRRKAKYDKYISYDARPVFLPIRPIATIAHARGTPMSNFIRDKLMAQARPWYHIRKKQRDGDVHEDPNNMNLQLHKMHYVRKLLDLPTGTRIHIDLINSILRKEEERLGSWEALRKEILRVVPGRTHYRRIRLRSSKEPIKSTAPDGHDRGGRRPPGPSKKIARFKSKVPS